MFKDAPVQVSSLFCLVFGLSPPDGLKDHVPEVGKLGGGVAAFLEVEVRPVVERLDDDILAAAAGEDDERYREAPAADFF